VNAQGLHGLVCKQAPSRIIRHHALNNVIARAIQSAGIPVTKEPVGSTRLNGKRPDGLTLIPWQGGKPLTWDVTVVSTLADSYLSSSTQSAGAATDLAASRKEAKYTSLTNSYIFQTIAVESHGAFSASALSFLTTLGERLTGTSGDLREMLCRYPPLTRHLSSSRQPPSSPFDLRSPWLSRRR